MQGVGHLRLVGAGGTIVWSSGRLGGGGRAPEFVIPPAFGNIIHPSSVRKRPSGGEGGLRVVMALGRTGVLHNAPPPPHFFFSQRVVDLKDTPRDPRGRGGGGGGSGGEAPAQLPPQHRQELYYTSNIIRDLCAKLS